MRAGDAATHHEPAANDAIIVLAATGIDDFSSSASTPAFAAVSPKRESGPCRSAAHKPWSARSAG